MEEPPSKEKHREEFLDPLFWKPECKGFEMMDWDKFNAMNPNPVPKVYDPPQRHSFFAGRSNLPLWWWNRSCFFQPCALMCVGCTPKPDMERISDDSGALIDKMLRPHPESANVPEALRNKLLWTENNVAPETLISFNRWAWRSQTEEGRVIGLGNLTYDWTAHPTCFGLGFTYFLKNRFANVQQSPDGKWLLLTTFSDPSVKGTVNHIFIYVVQPGDEFKDTDGNVLEHVQPGDTVRLTWDGDTVYDCDASKLTYMYFPRAVATLDEGRGVVVRNDLHYGDLLTKATLSLVPVRCARLVAICVQLA